jgi:hypothetical protein
MRTWPITDEGGTVTAFEVSMIRIGLCEIERILRANPEVSQLSRRRIFSPSEVHITFSYREAEYVVWEPFGDNSRYWIGPKDKPAQPHDVGELEGTFRAYIPSLLKRMFGWSRATTPL